MPDTIITTERFDPDIARERMDEEVRLRRKAGALRSWIEEKEEKWTLKTEWKVIGHE